MVPSMNFMATLQKLNPKASPLLETFNGEDIPILIFQKLKKEKRKRRLLNKQFSNKDPLGVDLECIQEVRTKPRDTFEVSKFGSRKKKSSQILKFEENNNSKKDESQSLKSSVSSNSVSESNSPIDQKELVSFL